jgi:hypothetical protein
MDKQMTIQLEGLLNEVDLILGTDLVPLRKYYFEGARDYLTMLKRLTQEFDVPPQKSRIKKAKTEQEPNV